jgi:hypothetical protein
VITVNLPVNDWRELVEQGWEIVKADLSAVISTSMLMFDAEAFMYQIHQILGAD